MLLERGEDPKKVKDGWAGGIGKSAKKLGFQRTTREKLQTGGKDCSRETDKKIMKKGSAQDAKDGENWG